MSTASRGGNHRSSIAVFISQFLKCHPLLRDALIWAVPALLFGAGLRLMLLHYSPFAYWGSDSRSYFGFASGVLTDFHFSLQEKRRYLYPLALLPVTMLPGSALRAVAWIQAGLGLLTVVAFAYLIRRVFVGWKLWIIPLTLLFAGLPVFLWYEHELIAESLYFQALVVALAGWAAWVAQTDPARARRLWWAFFVPFAVVVLTKPSAKFLWPGLAIALVLVVAWRVLRWKQWAALGALFLAGLTVGDEDQGAWLLYTTVFPMTQLETPRHAEYKAEIRELVEQKRARLDHYPDEDDEVHDFLREPEDYPARPLWQKLAEDERALARLYSDLTWEAIRARPDLFLYVALKRLAGSVNQTDFETDRFNATYFADRFAIALKNNRNSEKMLRLAFALPAGEPLPDAATFRSWLAPRPDSAVARSLRRYVDGYQRAGVLLNRPEGPGWSLAACRPTFLGWWVALAGLLALLPAYVRSVGVWVIAFAGAMLATYLVGIEHPRYFAPTWTLIILVLAVPLDLLVRAVAPRAK